MFLDSGLKLSPAPLPTLDPADLRGRTVALLVLGGDAEDDGRAAGGGAVDVGVEQVGGANNAGRLVAAVNPDERHLTRPLRAGRAALPHCQVHGVLQDPARGRRRGVPVYLDQIVHLQRHRRPFETF